MRGVRCEVLEIFFSFEVPSYYLSYYFGPHVFQRATKERKGLQFCKNVLTTSFSFPPDWVYAQKGLDGFIFFFK